jgi:GT2 family glycosyltransferase
MLSFFTKGSTGLGYRAKNLRRWWKKNSMRPGIGWRGEGGLAVAENFGALGAIASRDLSHLLDPAAMGIHGDIEFWIDTLSDKELRGWARRPGNPDNPITLEVVVDGENGTALSADHWRDDLQAAGKGSCAFEVRMPPLPRDNREHELCLRTQGEVLPFFRVMLHASLSDLPGGADSPSLGRPREIEFHIDALTLTKIAGWARRLNDLESPLAIELLVDGRPELNFRADGERSDLQAAAKGFCAFDVKIPPLPRDEREHEIALRIAVEPFFCFKQISVARVSHELEPSQMGVIGDLEFWIDTLTEDRISGWARDLTAVDKPLQIEILIDGKREAAFSAQEWRSDLVSAGKGACAFDVGISNWPRDGREHVLALRVQEEPFFRSKQLVSNLPVDGLDPAAMGHQGAVEFWIETLTDERISGWARKPEQPEKPLSIELLIDGKRQLIFRAAEWRSDLLIAGKGACGFDQLIPKLARDGHEHELMLYVDGEPTPFFRLLPRRFLRLAFDIPEFSLLGVRGSASAPGLLDIKVQVKLRLAGASLLATNVRLGEQFTWVPRDLRLSCELLTGEIANFELLLNGTAVHTRSCAIARSKESNAVIVIDERDGTRLSGIVVRRSGSESDGATLTCCGTRIGSRICLPGFDFDLVGLDLTDGIYELALEIDGSRFVISLDYQRYDIGIEANERGVTGFVRDNHAPGEPVGIEFLFDEKPVQNLTATQPHGQHGAVGFFIPASTNWRDGKLHDIRCRLLGTETVLPSQPVLAQFGSSGLQITHQIERWPDGAVTGFAFLAAFPEEIAYITLRQEHRFIAQTPANLPCRRLQVERLKASDRGFAFPIGSLGQGEAEIEIRIGPTTEKVTVHDRPCGAFCVQPAGQDRAGACVVLLELNDATAELEEARMLLFAAATLPNTMPLTIALAGERHSFLAHGAELSAMICDIGGHALVRQLSHASIVVTPSSAIPSSVCGCPRRAPHDFDLWARANDFSVIIAGARGGALAYLATAKRQGIAARESKLAILLDTLTIEARLANGYLLDDPVYLKTEGLERIAVASVDDIVAISERALATAQNGGFNLAAGTVVRGLTVPSETSWHERSQGRALLFLGPLEARTGLLTFCDALDRLAREPELPHDLRIVLIGPSSGIRGEDSLIYLRRRATNWPFPVEILASLTWDRMREVVARLPEQTFVLDFPGVRGSAFAALADQAGFAVVGPDARWPDNPSAFGEVLLNQLKSSEPAKKKIPLEHSGIFEGICEPSPPKPNSVSQISAAPLVTVCVPHFNRPTLLNQTLNAIVANDYPSMEIIVVDDGSAGPGVRKEQEGVESWLAQHNGRLIRQPNRHLGATRNEAFRRARGAFVVFLDDDNLPFSDMITRFVQVQHATGAAIVTSRYALFEGTASIEPQRDIPRAIEIPLGPSVSAAPILNCFGDGTMLITREAFEQIGGYAEEYGYAHGDWELYCRAQLMGLHIETIPMPLFWYRVSKDSMLRGRESESTDLARNIRPYGASVTPEIYRIVQLAQGVVQRWHGLLTVSSTHYR